MAETEVGKVTHYYGKASVAAIELMAPVSIGDTIAVRGATTEFEQTIESMQIDHQNIEKAGAGQTIGIKVKDKVRAGDIVYKKN